MGGDSYPFRKHCCLNRKGVRGKDTIPLLIYACDNYNIINNSKWVEILTHFSKIIPIIFPKKS